MLLLAVDLIILGFVLYWAVLIGLYVIATKDKGD